MSFKAWGTRNVLLPLSLLPTRSRYLKLARSIQARQFWPLEKTQRYQLEKLRLLVEKAIQDSSYYRQRLGDLGLTAASLQTLADFSKFPVTSKSDIESNFPDGMVDLKKRTSDWYYAGTRGTTRRVVVIHDFAKRDAERAGELVVTTTDCPFSLGEQQIAIPPDACSTHCGIESRRAERVRDHLWELASRRKPVNRESISDLRGLVMDRWIRCYQSLPPLEPDFQEEVLRDYISRLRELRPKMLVALPEYLRALAKYIERTGDRPPAIAVVRPMGANMPASWKPSIENVFGGQVRENYGSREMGPMAFDCNLRCGLHTLMDQFYFEVVDSDGQPVPDGQVGQVLVTDLQNWTMPILRYSIGDLARIERAPCKCGRTSHRLHMQGRVTDAFEVDGKWVTAESIANLLFERYGIDQFELTQTEKTRFQLRYVPPDSTIIDDATLSATIVAESGLKGEIRTRSTTLIRPESSGKFRPCKSRSELNSEHP